MPGPLSNIQRVIPGLIEPAGKPTVKLDVNASPEGENFGQLFSQFIDAVNDLHNEVGEAQSALLAGEPVELHDVMIKGEEAGIATDLLLEIRNRLVDGFNELMRMPI